MTKRYVVGFDEFDINAEEPLELHDDICVEINNWLKLNPNAKLIDVKYQATHVGKVLEWKEVEKDGLSSHKVVYSAMIIVEEEV